MLTITRLDVVDFGPFKGEQSIEFPKDAGVTIVYGENMRGKTYLLNAIRYALFGKILSRGLRSVDINQVCNWESVANGKYGFKVTLFFDHDGNEYELTRECRPKNDSARPGDNDDYIQDCFLRKDGNVLSPAQREIELARSIPEQVSRFFLFDGELLQEYEELLRDESEMGRKITEAIERILGVPIITNSRIDLNQRLREAQRQESRSAQKDQRTQELGNHLEELMNQLTYHEDERKRLEKDLEEAKDRKTRLEATVKKNEGIRALLGQRDTLEKEIEEIDVKLQAKQNQLKDVMSGAWRGMLNIKIKDTKDNIRENIDKIQTQITEKALNLKLLEIAKKATSEGICPTCENQMDRDATGRLRKKIQEYESIDYQIDEKERLRLAQLLSTLENFETTDVSTIVESITYNIDELIVEKASKKDRIKDINEKAEGYDESQIRYHYAEYEKCIEEKKIIGDGIRKERDLIREKGDNIRDLQKQLDKFTPGDITKERKRREIYEKLCNLFSEAVGVYRDRLRGMVEKDATDLFVRLISEQDYAGLKINENYGLTIMHKDNQSIPVRSAGAEHIVALSLMGALQKNAPLRGPIIMDSPFGRLDETHTMKVVRTLPFMADQVVLLVYESELKPQFARDELLGKLKAEYKMNRASARHTRLEKSVEIER